MMEEEVMLAMFESLRIIMVRWNQLGSDIDGEGSGEIWGFCCS